MKKTLSKNERLERRKARVRTRVQGTSEKPRFAVTRSLKSLYLQLIDDNAQKTVCAVSEHLIKAQDVEGKKGKVAKAYLTGKKLAEMAFEKNIKKVVFDRGGRVYAGRIKACAEGAREGGLEF